jgi:hypothetical protein
MTDAARAWLLTQYSCFADNLAKTKNTQRMRIFGPQVMEHECNKFETIRNAALALPDTTEEPHHHYGSFRARGEIFVTIPPGLTHIHVFLSEQDRELALTVYPEFTEKLLWGGKVVGIRIRLQQPRRQQ